MPVYVLTWKCGEPRFKNLKLLARKVGTISNATRRINIAAFKQKFI